MAAASTAIIISLFNLLLLILALRNKPSRAISRQIAEFKKEIANLQERVEKCESDRADLRDENFRLRSRIEKLERKSP